MNYNIEDCEDWWSPGCRSSLVSDSNSFFLEDCEDWSYLLRYSTMVSVGRSVRSYVCADLLSTREGSLSKGGYIFTPLPPLDPPVQS